MKASKSKLDTAAALQQALSAYGRGQMTDAERLCRLIIESKADHFDALHLLADVQCQQGRLADALSVYDRALAIRPDHADALIDRGSTCLELNRYDEALLSYDRSLAVRPGHPLALFNRGVALQALNRAEDALSSYEQALAAAPQYPEALNNSGIVLKTLRRTEEALARFDRALAVRPDHARAHNNRGNALNDLGRREEALASFDSSIAIQPDDPEAHYNRGLTLMELKRYSEARNSFERVLALNPDHRHALSALADSALRSCDWPLSESLAGKLRAHVESGKSVVSPFVLVGAVDDAALHARCAMHFAASQMAVEGLPRRHRGHHCTVDKIKVAYLSGDFRQHAIGGLVAGLFEQHDRSRFEIFGLSYGPDDRSDLRARIAKGFDRFYDVRSQCDRQVANLIRELDADIAVDLSGYTTGARSEILASRPAPVQVNYLGFPGTMGADFIDYVLADPVVLPFKQQQFYREKIIHLPECYQVNDSRRLWPVTTIARAEAGLPGQGFVFCCFNQNYKIARPVFEAWMRLLQAIDGSVLWLLHDSASVTDRLRNEAAARGVDPARLVFAGPLPLEEHLGRHRLADLFLDTLPYNAHTTASDALWMGLPVVTWQGDAFAGRVAASALKAAGLPELVTWSLAEYEALALRLARDPLLLAELRSRLLHGRDTCPLFDTARSARHIEAAYTTICEIADRGEAPRGFAVPAIS